MSTLKFVRSVWESFRATSGLEPRLLDNLTITSARPGLVRFSLPIEPHHLNRLGILHGGTIASLTDASGSLAVASRGLFATGVSTDLSVTYLASGGVPGEALAGEVACDRFGRNLAYTRVTFWNARGEVAARGSHTKFVRLAWADERNVTERAAGEWAEEAEREERMEKGKVDGMHGVEGEEKLEEKEKKGHGAEGGSGDVKLGDGETRGWGV